MFMKPFCNHEFIYINKELIVNFPGSDEYLFKFICRRCRKKKNISSLNIEKVANKFANELAMKEAIDGFSDRSVTKFSFPIRQGYSNFEYLMLGFVADKTIEHFYMKYGTDITQIKDESI